MLLPRFPMRNLARVDIDNWIAAELFHLPCDSYLQSGQDFWRKCSWVLSGRIHRLPGNPQAVLSSRLKVVIGIDRFAILAWLEARPGKRARSRAFLEIGTTLDSAVDRNDDLVCSQAGAGETPHFRYLPNGRKQDRSCDRKRQSLAGIPIASFAPSSFNAS